MVLSEKATNQYTNLPKPTDFNLWTWKMQLTNFADFEAWRRSAYNTLKARRLHNLLNWELPRLALSQRNIEEAPTMSIPT